MITTTDVQNIITAACKVAFAGIGVCQYGNVPDGEVDSVRAIVAAKRPESETYFRKGFVEVNILVPAIDGKADLITLNSYERLSAQTFGKVTTGTYDGSFYRYSGETSLEYDYELKCYFINTRILFEVLNAK